MKFGRVKLFLFSLILCALIFNLSAYAHSEYKVTSLGHIKVQIDSVSYNLVEDDEFKLIYRNENGWNYFIIEILKTSNPQLTPRLWAIIGEQSFLTQIDQGKIKNLSDAHYDVVTDKRIFIKIGERDDYISEGDQFIIEDDESWKIDFKIIASQRFDHVGTEAYIGKKSFNRNIQNGNIIRRPNKSIEERISTLGVLSVDGLDNDFLTELDSNQYHKTLEPIILKQFIDRNSLRYGSLNNYILDEENLFRLGQVTPNGLRLVFVHEKDGRQISEVPFFITESIFQGLRSDGRIEIVDLKEEFLDEVSAPPEIEEQENIKDQIEEAETAPNVQSGFNTDSDNEYCPQDGLVFEVKKTFDVIDPNLDADESHRKVKIRSCIRTVVNTRKDKICSLEFLDENGQSTTKKPLLTFYRNLIVNDSIEISEACDQAAQTVIVDKFKTRQEIMQDKIETYPEELQSKIHNHEIFDQCNHEEHINFQNVLSKNINPDVASYDEVKLCIYAGMKLAPPSLKTATCEDGVQNNAATASKDRICATNNYISFVWKELRKMASCWDNITAEELLPMVFSESNFMYNAYNNYRGKLNASGLLQLTNALIKNPDTMYVKRQTVIDQEDPLYPWDIDQNYCSNILAEVNDDPFEVRKKGQHTNICAETEIPHGLRKSLFYTIGQYQFFKSGNYQYTARNMLIDLFGKKFFDKKDFDKIVIDVTRFIHNRGPGKIKKLLELFRNDVLNKEVILDKYGSPLGNRSLATLVNGYGFLGIGRSIRLPMKQLDFLKYFSGYIYYEAPYTSTSYASKKNKSKKHKRRYEAEGAAFAMNVACGQLNLEREVRKQFGIDVTCGPYPISQELRREIGNITLCDKGYLSNKVKKNLSHFY